MAFEASLGFRNISMTMKLLSRESKIERAPSHETCIQWALKLGFYKMFLQRKREDGQWIWIADHAVKAGIDKCLIVVGIRLDQIAGRKDLTLNLDDVTALGIIPMKVSNGKTVNEELEKLAAKTGIPKAILNDHGSDLRSGVEKFCLNHQEVQSFYDIVHKIARNLAKILENDLTWQTFTLAASQSKKELQLSELHRLAPPNQRSKARWLNIDVLTDWAAKCLEGANAGLYKLPKQLQWLHDCENKVLHWKQCTEVARITRSVVRTYGYGKCTGRILEDSLLKIDTSNPFVEELACELIDFVDKECEHMTTMDRMIGSSEVIESGIGWFKNLLGKTHWSRLGMGRLTLALAGKLGGADITTVQQALQSVKWSDIENWLNTAFAA